jgi:hypothetical protein
MPPRHGARIQPKLMPMLPPDENGRPRERLRGHRRRLEVPDDCGQLKELHAGRARGAGQLIHRLAHAPVSSRTNAMAPVD